jgi:molecular chaperone HtpG
MFKDEGIDAVVLTHNIDQPFISYVESKNENVKFLRIDADISDTFKEEAGDEDLTAMTETLSQVFKKALNKESLNIKVEKLKNSEISSMITISEESRRMQDMMRMYNMSADMFLNEGQTLILNSNNTLVQHVLAHTDDEGTDLICMQLYDLAKLAHTTLSPEEMTAFITRSNDILKMLASK